MSDRALSRLAVVLGGVAVAATVASIVMLRLTWDVPRPEDFAFPSFGMEVASRLQFLLVPLVGAFVVWQRPRNRVGWLLCAGGLGFPLWDLAEAYATYSVHISSLAGGMLAAWGTNWLWALTWWMPGLLFLIFPTGRLASPRWRPVAWGVVSVGVAVLLFGALLSGPLHQFAGVDNPFGVIPAGSDPEAILGPLFALGMLGFLLGATSLVLRYRRARGDERAQIKWFAFAAAIFVAYMGSGILLRWEGPFEVVLGMVVSLALGGALGISLLKYRLYDIDVVISRTVAYTILTALLAGTYLGIVMVLQAVLAPLTPDSQLSVAGATLAVAAAFGPLRRRVQTVVDRRFNRHRYDAQQTLETFTARLRDEVDLGQITDDLLAVVGGTVQPADASLWLRPAGADHE
jgi:hypothetical protein